jgi:signal transduction histidine kinase
VLANLVQNSIKYSNKGLIKIKAKCISKIDGRSI